MNTIIGGTRAAFDELLELIRQQREAMQAIRFAMQTLHNGFSVASASAKAEIGVEVAALHLGALAGAAGAGGRAGS